MYILHVGSFVDSFSSSLQQALQLNDKDLILYYGCFMN